MAGPGDQGAPEDIYQGLGDLSPLALLDDDMVDPSGSHQRQKGGWPYMSMDDDYISSLELEMQFLDEELWSADSTCGKDVASPKDKALSEADLEVQIASYAIFTEIAEKMIKEYTYKWDQLSRWKEENWSDGFIEKLKRENYKLKSTVAILKIELEAARKKKEILQNAVQLQ